MIRQFVLAYLYAASAQFRYEFEASMASPTDWSLYKKAIEFKKYYCNEVKD